MSRPSLLDDVVSFQRWNITQPEYARNGFVIGMYDAIFLQDFGPWKKGYVAHTLNFHIISCELIEANHDEIMVNSCKVFFIPLDSNYK